MDKMTISFEMESGELTDRLDVGYYSTRRDVTAALAGVTGVPLHSLCRPIRTKTPAKDAYTTSGVPCLKLKNITGRFIDTASVDYVATSVASKYVAAQYLDLIVTATGEGTAGRAAIFTEQGKYIVTGENILLRPDKTAINPFYLLAMLRTSVVAQQLTTYVRGATGQTHLYWQDIANILIPVGAKAVQLECEKLYGEADKRSREAAEILEQIRVIGEGQLVGVGVKKKK